MRRRSHYDRPTGRKVELVDAKLKVLRCVMVVAAELLISMRQFVVTKDSDLLHVYSIFLLVDGHVTGSNNIPMRAQDYEATEVSVYNSDV